MNEKRTTALVAAVILLLAAGETALLAYFGRGTWYDRIGFILQILAVYGIGIGFVQKSDLLKNFSGIEDMTSAHPVKFLRGNFIFLGVFSSLAGVALSRNRSEKSSVALGCFGQLLVVLLTPLIFLYYLIHLVLICPFAYIGYLFSSALVEVITGASDDMEWSSISPGEPGQKMSIREIIASNPTAAKSFLIGIPATLLSFLTKGIGLFLK